MHYYIRWKKKFIWHTDGPLKGHRLDKELNRMDMFFADGSLKSIPQWNKCTMKLGTDWVLFTKDAMEQEAGREIKLKVGGTA